MASRSGAQGRLRPCAPEAARQHRRSGTWERYGEQRTVRGQSRRASSPCPYAGSGLARGRCGGDMSTPQKRPPTRHYLQTTSDNRRSGRPGGSQDGRPGRARTDILPLHADPMPCSRSLACCPVNLFCMPMSGRRIVACLRAVLYIAKCAPIVNLALSSVWDHALPNRRCQKLIISRADWARSDGRQMSICDLVCEG